MNSPELTKNAPNMLREEVSPRSVLTTKPIPKPSFDTGGMGGFDYKKEIDKIASASSAGGPSLQIDLGIAPPRLVSDLDLDGLLLAQAREHIRKKQFDQALTKLE